MTSAVIKRITIIGAILVVLLLLYIVVLNISRAGETAVTVRVVPEDSLVKIGDETVKPGIHYLKPGIYTFTASRDGWSKDEWRVRIGTEEITVNLLPEPSSSEALKYLADNPDIQQMREGMNDENAHTRGAEYTSNNPIVEVLPHVEISPPFSIDYGVPPSRPDGVYLLISDSTPEGRVAALEWIRQQGYDPTDLEIRYYDFINPLYRESQTNE